MSARTVSVEIIGLRPNGLAIRMQRWFDDRTGPIIIPNVDEQVGDYAELVDEHDHPISIALHPISVPIVEKWWARYCRKDGRVVWRMPFAVWQECRNRAAADAMNPFWQETP